MMIKDRQKSNILLVDDEPFVISSLRNLLEFNYTIYSAENGKRALEILANTPIKVILCDQRMPGMMGHEVLREAKRISPNSIRILLTGYSDLESIINSVNTGEIFRYLNKPWKSEIVENIVKLGVQIYDRLTELTGHQELKPPTSTKPQTTTTSVLPSQIHIEVQEKHPSVLFVGYESSEIVSLTQKVKEKFNVLKSHTIDDAINQIAEKSVSVIVSNVDFDKINAVDFLSSVKHDFPHVVTVILTEVVDAELAIRSINELNVFRYLVKPITESQLGEVLDSAVAKNQSFQTTPQLNLHFNAKQIAPNTNNENANESVLRLKLRAVLANISKDKP